MARLMQEDRRWTNTQPPIDEQGTAERRKGGVSLLARSSFQCLRLCVIPLPAADCRTWKFCGSLFVNLLFACIANLPLVSGSVNRHGRRSLPSSRGRFLG